MTDYLPKTNVTLNDLGLKIAPPPAGPKVTLLGITSNSGIPIREPYTVTSVEKAINALYFSGVPNINSGGAFPGELAIAVEEASNAGAPNIEVIVIGHYNSTGLLNYIDLDRDQSGRYNDLSGAYDVLKNSDVDIVVPVGAYADVNPSASENDTFAKQLADFCYQSTKENNACVGVIPTMPVMHWAYKYKNYLANGNSTLATELNNTFFTGSLSISTTASGALGNVLSGVGTASGSYLTTTQFKDALRGMYFGVPSATLLDQWVKYHTLESGNLTAGFTNNIGTAYSATYLNWLYGAADQDGNVLSNIVELNATSVNSSYFSTWQAINSDGSAGVDSRNVKVDAGGYISVFSTPLKAVLSQNPQIVTALSQTPGTRSVNIAGAASYAGLINTLAPQSATTNKQIEGVGALRLLSVRQANNLVGMRHVTMYNRNEGLTVAKGVTGAHNVTQYIRSDYVNLSTVRIVTATVDLIRGVTNKYIGEPNNAPQINAMDAEIDQLLLNLKSQGALNGYDYSISSTPEQRVLGELDVNLTLVPAFEINTINVVISLADEI